MQIGKKIAKVRRAQNMTQEQLAEKMGVTRQTVSRWESNLSYPEMEKMIVLARVLGVSCDYLLDDAMETMKARQGSELTAGEERKAGETNLVTRLLLESKGKMVKLTFYDDAEDAELFDTPCCLVDFDGQWMRVSYKKGKQAAEKLLAVNGVLSMMFMEEM